MNAAQIRGEIRENRISIIGAHAVSVKVANKYRKIDILIRISAKIVIFSFPK